MQGVNGQSMSTISALLKMGFQMSDQGETQHLAYAKGLVALIAEISLQNEMLYHLLRQKG